MERVNGVIARVKSKAVSRDPVFGCCSLQKAATIVAIFDMVIAGIALIVGIILAIFGTGAEVDVVVGPDIAQTKIDVEEGVTTPENKAAGTKISVFATIISVVMILVYAAILGLAVLLYIGAKKRDYSKVRLWFIINCVCAVIVVIDALGSMLSFGGFIYLLLTLLITLYKLWIVYAFMHEIDPDNLAARLEDGGNFQGIPISSNPDEVQFSKNPYEGQQTQQQPGYGQAADPYGWDN